MKVKVKSDELKGRVPLVAQAASGKLNGVGTEILSCLLLDAAGGKLTLTGVSADISIVKVMDAEVETGGKAAVPAKLLADVVPFCKGERTTIETIGSGKLRVQSGNFRIDLAVVPPDNFPVVEPEQAQGAVQVPAKKLREMIGAVSGSAAANDGARPALAAASLTIQRDEKKGEQLALAALDGYRLAEATLPVKLPEGLDKVTALLPVKACEKLERLLDEDDSVSVGLTGGGKMQFRFNGTTVSITQVSGNFPDYANFFPKEAPTVVTMHAAALLESIKMGRLLSERGTIVVNCTENGGGSVSLEAQGDAGAAKNKIEANQKGASVTLAVNLDYLRNAAEACARLGYKGLMIAANGDALPILIKPVPTAEEKDNPGAKFVIMPFSKPAAREETKKE